MRELRDKMAEMYGKNTSADEAVSASAETGLISL
jgi:hypothetical protein